jgi:cytidyltransferase-like protein
MIKGVIAGAFDVYHPGYVEAFKRAKEKCDCLIVLLHTDPSIERPEKLQPILTVEERKEMLLSIRYIDDVVRYTYEEQLLDLLKMGEFNIRFLGDDYLGKPFSMEDLKLRIASTLRCAKTDIHHDKVNINHISRVINSANLNISMNKKNGEVLVRNQNVKLTPIEFDLLYALIKEQGEVLSKARLYQSVLLREFSRYDRTLDMHISKIRKKITAAGIEVNSIKTVRGQGYCFDE